MRRGERERAAEPEEEEEREAVVEVVGCHSRVKLLAEGRALGEGEGEHRALKVDKT